MTALKLHLDPVPRAAPVRSADSPEGFRREDWDALVDETRQRWQLIGQITMLASELGLGRLAALLTYAQAAHRAQAWPEAPGIDAPAEDEPDPTTTPTSPTPSKGGPRGPRMGA